MDIQTYLARFEREGEHPLDELVTDGGLTGILRTVGCIGDSLSSGEFETVDADGTKHYHDLFDYSWGQYLARMAGLTAYNFSRGGMTAKEYMESFAEAKGFWDPALACQAYIVALGVNDIMNRGYALGSLDTLNTDSPSSFADYYVALLLRLREISPDSRIFLMSMPRADESEERAEKRRAHAALLYEIAAYIGNAYVLDFNRYAPVYDAAFRRRFFLHGHMNAAGYLLTAKMVASYIDYIIRHDPDGFRRIGLVGTPFRDGE